jgi:hypothetical protein
MNRRNILGLTALAALGLAMLPGSAVSQPKSLKDQLVGTWNIVSVTVTQKNGSKIDPWGANSKGILIFTGDGRFVLVNTRAGLPKFASDNRLQGTADENKAITQGILAYFGTYTVDETGKTYTAHIDASSFPNDDGSDQKRPITLLTADELHFTNPAGTVGGAAEVIAKRAM